MPNLLEGALAGTASAMKDEDLGEYQRLLFHGEQIRVGFKVVRDAILFTDYRVIIEDVQGITGRKREYLSIPYNKIAAFSVETAGLLDMDAELKIWVSGLPSPVEHKFNRKTNIYEIEALLAAATSS